MPRCSKRVIGRNAGRSIVAAREPLVGITRDLHHPRVVGDVGGEVQGAADHQPIGERPDDLGVDEAPVVLAHLGPRVGEVDPDPGER